MPDKSQTATTFSPRTQPQLIQKLHKTAITGPILYQSPQDWTRNDPCVL